MKVAEKNWMVWLAACFALVMLIFSVLGAWRFYYPLPFSDSWHGALQFYIEASDGNYAAWWVQHNEHRIFLSRILFWIEYRFLGSGVFLIILNYVFVALSCLVFLRVLREAGRDGVSSPASAVVFLVICGMLFSWVQSENFLWEFQSQFFMAQLLPLAAFLFLGLFACHGQERHFIFACVLGFASIGTMANGILALPLMVICALFFRLTWRRVLILVTLSCIGVALYLYGYVPPHGHGSLLKELKTNLTGLARYTFHFMGSPLFFLLGPRSSNIVRAEFCGAIFILISCVVFLRVLVHKNGSAVVRNLSMSLLFFIAFVVGSAFAAAGSRVLFGFDQALTSRYTTPVLLAWACLVVVCWLWLCQKDRKWLRWMFLIFCFAFCVLMLRYQFRETMRPRNQMIQDREMAALSMAMGVMDSAAIRSVYYTPPLAFALSAEAVRRRISIFGIYPFMGLKDKLNLPMGGGASSLCSGRIEKIEEPPEERGGGWSRIYGTITAPQGTELPRLFHLYAEDGKAQGLALTFRKKAFLNDGRKGDPLPFNLYGYIPTPDSPGSKWVLQGDQGGCRLQVTAP